jgi:hypothetical protein
VRALGAIALSVRYRGLSIQGCFCPEECTGANGQDCGNTMPSLGLNTVTEGRGHDLHPKYLRARRDIPGMLFTVFGGVVVQERTRNNSSHI